MQSTAKTTLFAELAQTTKRRNSPSSYRIEYQPQLVEETVLRAIVGHAEENLFREARNRVYELQNLEAREEKFQELHQCWFEHLNLSDSLREVLTFWPILKLFTHKCLLVKAPSKKDMSAELYVASNKSRLENRAGCAIVIQLSPELLTQSQQLLPFLRHELLHIVDMLDPGFGYEPNLPRSNMGATYDRLLQERYRTLWDITVAGRLFQYGWLPASIREKHWTIFKNIFPGSVEDLESVFSFFFNNISPKHPELVSFSLTPEAWFASSNSKAISKGMCSLCHFPAHHLIDASISLSPSLIDAIQKEYPNWNPTESICRQCADLYELRTDTG